MLSIIDFAVVTRDDRRSIILNGQSLQLPDLILTRTGSGTDYFSLAIIRQLERLGVRAINSSHAIEKVKDKLYTAQILAEKNLPTPKTMLVRYPLDGKQVKKQLGFPCVVKVVSGSLGRGIYLSKDEDSFNDLVELVSSLKGSMNLIVQEFISFKPGSDLRVWVIGGKVIGAMMRSSTDGSFKANISRGGKGELFVVDEKIEKLALETAEALELDIAGIDLLFDTSEYKVCEANSSPDFEGFETYCDVNIAEKIVEYCKKI